MRVAPLQHPNSPQTVLAEPNQSSTAQSRLQTSYEYITSGAIGERSSPSITLDDNTAVIIADGVTSEDVPWDNTYPITYCLIDGPGSFTATITYGYIEYVTPMNRADDEYNAHIQEDESNGVNFTPSSSGCPLISS